MIDVGNAFQAGQRTLLTGAESDVADYGARFAPLARSIMGAGRDPFAARDEAAGRVSTAFSTMPGMLERRRSGLGAAAGADVAASEGRRTSLARAIANADAQTRAIRGNKDLRQQAQGFAFDAYADDIGTSNKLAAGVAQSDTQRELDYQRQMDQYRQQKAQRKGGILSLVGTAIGMVAGGPLGAKIGGAIGGSLGG